MDRLTLYIANRNYSSWSLRPWLALKHAGLAFDEVIIPLDRPETRESILRHSPSGRVPALTHGGLRVWDSLAICEYVAELAPAAKLWPEDARARAVARAVSAEMHAGFATVRQRMPMNVRRTFEPMTVDDETRSEITRIGAIWSDCRERYGAGGQFLFGAFTIADAMFAPVATRFRTYGIDARAGVGAVGRAYVEAIWSHPAMQEWARLSASEAWELPKYDAAGTPAAASV